jgi:hypothetical protein
VRRVYRRAAVQLQKQRAQRIGDAQEQGEIDPNLNAEALERYTTVIVFGSLGVEALGLRPWIASTGTPSSRASSTPFGQSARARRDGGEHGPDRDP